MVTVDKYNSFNIQDRQKYLSYFPLRYAFKLVEFTDVVTIETIGTPLDLVQT
jgi:hypothetical protein